MSFRTAAVLCLLSCATACVSEDTAGEGNVSIVLGGGRAMRDGFPHTEGSENHAFVDGWEMDFSKCVVSVGNIALTRPGSDDVEASWDNTAVVDLKRSGDATRPLATLEAVSARRLNVGFSLLPPPASPGLVDADAEDVEEMRAKGYTVLLAGTASRGEETVPFRFGVAAAARFEQCTNGEDGTLGLAVEANKTSSVFLYMHVVHFFWDALTESAALRFDAMAAVAGDDGAVSTEELAVQDLLGLEGADGGDLLDQNGLPVLYDDGGLLPPGQTSLLDYLRYAAAQSIHFNGLGVCESRWLE
jgi:hypothetical protein